MEIGCLVTDSNLNVVAEGPNLVIHQPSDVLQGMDEWCTKQHNKVKYVQYAVSATRNVFSADRFNGRMFEIERVGGRGGEYRVGVPDEPRDEQTKPPRRQQRLHGQDISQEVHAEGRRLLALQDNRRVHRQGAVSQVEQGRSQGNAEEGIFAQGSRGHTGERQGVEILQGAFFQKRIVITTLI